MPKNDSWHRPFLASILLMITSVCPAAQLQISPEGVLTGARNVSLDGRLYNVEFVEGSCDGVFNGCDDPSDFALRSLDLTEAAAEALGSQVLLDAFDLNPDQVFGCNDPLQCMLILPSMLSDGFLFAYTWTNYAGSEEDLGNEDASSPSLVLLDLDTAEASDMVYARWTAVPVSAPSPLHCLAALSLAAFLRTRKARRAVGAALQGAQPHLL